MSRPAADELIAYLHLKDLQGKLTDDSLKMLLGRAVMESRRQPPGAAAVAGFPVKTGSVLQFNGGPLDGVTWSIGYPADHVIVGTNDAGAWFYECVSGTKFKGGEIRVMILAEAPSDFMDAVRWPP